MNISLIIPCYNEETNIQKGVLDKIGNYAAQHKYIKEVLISDDGSTDSTRELITERYLPHFKLFRLIENTHGGKAYAVISGIQHSKEDFVIFMDMDLATPVEEIEKLIEEAERGNDIVIGSRKGTRAGAPLPRKIMAVGFIVVRNIILGLHGIRDTQCGFKLFNRRVAEEIISRLRVFHRPHHISGSSVSAGFDLEFLFLAQKLNYKICEIPVTWRHVETKNVSFIKDTFETLRDIARIKYYDIRGSYK
ncbi:glycosyltransferase [Candidatus Microgenomates bacterium]|nr:glycosyltransferase [Candidatus Microgenomates bacterium]